MHILVSNDDGYASPWLQHLVDALLPFGRISVVAPTHDHSGASSSLTLRKPLRATTMDNGFIHIDGTPADCVHLGVTGLLDEPPDMVVAGINMGANLGDDVLYSGTVAAALEGRFLGRPALAFSMVRKDAENVDTAKMVVTQIMQGLEKKPLAANTILNVNIPDIAIAQCKGLLATRLGHRHIADDLLLSDDPYDQPIYWIGPAGAAKDDKPGSDFYAVKNGYVSVTPLQTDMTQHTALDDLSGWIDTLAPWAEN